MLHLNSRLLMVDIVPGNGFIQRRNELISQSISHSDSTAAITASILSSTSTTAEQSNITSFIPTIQWFVKNIPWTSGKGSTYLPQRATSSSRGVEGATPQCIPFMILDNEHYCAAFGTLLVNFQPALGEYISNNILLKLYGDIQCEVVSEVVHATAITLSTDGWSDRKHQSVHNPMVCTPTPWHYSRYKQNREKVDADTIYFIFCEGRMAISMEFESTKQTVPFLWAYLCDSTNVMRAVSLRDPDASGMVVHHIL
jgi:hypothetical protein